VLRRSAAAECIPEQRVGHSAHAARDVQLPAPPHPASLPHPAAQSAASASPGPADDAVPAASLVRQSRFFENTELQSGSLAYWQCCWFHISEITLYRAHSGPVQALGL